MRRHLRSQEEIEKDILAKLAQHGPMSPTLLISYAGLSSNRENFDKLYDLEKRGLVRMEEENYRTMIYPLVLV